MAIFAQNKMRQIMAEAGKHPRWMERLAVYGNALERLTVVVNLSKKQKLNEFERDSLIKRFEFAYEMGWKLMMSFEKENGITGMLGSKDVIRHAVALGVIENGEAWMDMIDARNQTSHVYDEDTALSTLPTASYTHFILCCWHCKKR